MALGFFLVILILFHGVRAIVPLFLGGLGLLSLNQDFSFGRAFDLIVTLLTDDSSFSDKIFLLVNTSGNRLVSIYSSFNFPFYHFFGGGIGNWKESSIEALSLINFDVSQLNYIIRFGEDSGMRSSGFVSNLVLDTGIPGLLFLILHLKRHLKKYWNISKESKTIIVIFLVKIFFIGSVGHPVAWLLVIVALKYLYVNRKETINQSITQSITNTI